MTTTSGRRPTRQREAIAAVLARHNQFVSAQQLHTALVAEGRQVGLATVYRALHEMADEGAVDMLRTPEGEAVYRACATGQHHHHLVCRDCGRTVEVAASAVERWAERTAADHGFADVSHTVEIFGRCTRCT